MKDVLCDLDGVVYVGGSPIPGSAEGLRRLEEAGARVLFVTNNSTRTPEEGAAKISRLTGLQVDPGRVVTSALAAASMLAPEDGPVMVIGGDGLREAVRAAGHELSEGGVGAVVVGLDRGIDYDKIDRAAGAVRAGARFIASNVDPTFPSESGLRPGAGAIVAAIERAGGRPAEVAGKPHPPFRRLLAGLGVTDALVIGDRLDTDIALARTVPGWESILVLSGVTSMDQARGGADHVVADLSEAADLAIRLSARR